MSWKITTLDLGQVELNMSRMLPNAESGALVRVPVQGWLLTGGGDPIVIDTGFRHPDILKRLGDRARGVETPEQRLVAQLALHGMKPADVRYVLHTHLHIDHAGQTDSFPMASTAVVNRRELEYSVSGLSGPSYPPEDIKHLIDRLHSPGSLRLLDLELTGQEEILPGVRCLVAGGHTEGSMVVQVDTEDGLASFCGDLVYSIEYQLLKPRVNDRDPGLSANYVVPRRAEKAALKRLLASSERFVLYPSHDLPVTIERGLVVEGSLHAASPHGGMGGCWCRVLETETAAAG